MFGGIDVGKVGCIRTWRIDAKWLSILAAGGCRKCT